MSKNKQPYFDQIDYQYIVNNIKGIYTSDGTMAALLDFERVLDESDLYAFKNWEYGELVDGPKVKKYTTSCVFMYHEKLMPDPSAGNRLITIGCNVQFKKTKIKVPVKVTNYDDFEPGTKYQKMKEHSVWLVQIIMPKDLMDDIREGSIELADQTMDLGDLDEAYADDLDETQVKEDDGSANMMGGF